MPPNQDLKQLEKAFAAVNTVASFLASRKHVPPLFSTLAAALRRSSDESDETDDGLPMQLAMFAVILPHAIRFEYVDKADLKAIDARDVVYAPYESSSQTRDILIFEFVDQHIRSRSASPAPNGGRKTPPVLMPRYSTESVTRLITQRNKRFEDGVRRFAVQCRATNTDPLVVLRSRARDILPHRIPDSPELVPTALEYTNGISNEVSKIRLPISRIVENMTDNPQYSGQIVDARVIPSQTARYGELTFRLSQALVDALYSVSGVENFYTHQTASLNALEDGSNVIVATSTSSGKSLIYQIPVIRSMEKDPRATAMFIFPTKALAQDQRRSLASLIALMPELSDKVVATYDGDTPKDERAYLRKNASVLFTNPDTLHASILPRSLSDDGWRRFLRALKIVVVDELHVYAGLFGTHVAFVMRRLRRLCAALGNDSVQFVSCSATISNPRAHMSSLFGLTLDEVIVIVDDGAPAGAKHILLWNSPYKDPYSPALGRRSAVLEAADVVASLIVAGVRTIAFCRVRDMCENMTKSLRHVLEARGYGTLCDRVMSYRGGYTPADRRRIEHEMFSGTLLAIVATSALELGIDIGALDAVVIVGFPYTVANLRQQSGRAGRRSRDSLTVVVGDSYPVDQHYMKNPGELFESPLTDVVVDLDNILVLEAHVQCAAFESPINIDEDKTFFGPKLKDIAENRLVCVDHENMLYESHPRFMPWPSSHVSLREGDEEMYAVVDVTGGRNIVIEEIEVSRITFTLYEGAVFVHQGRTYLVLDLDTDKRIARVERTKVDWTTSQRDYTDVDAQETRALRRLDSNSDIFVYYGSIKVTMVVFGYFKMDSQGRILDAVDVTTTPRVELFTSGTWIDIPNRAIEMITAKGLHVAGSIHAAEHILMSMAYGIVSAAMNDLSTECKAPEKEFSSRETNRKRPARLIFYDSHGAGKRDNSKETSVTSLSRADVYGSGMSRKVFEFFDTVVHMALDRISSCKCDYGCPECVTATNCRERALVLSKSGAHIILHAIAHDNSNDTETEKDDEGMTNITAISREITTNPRNKTIVPVTGIVPFSQDVEIIASHTLNREVFKVKKVE
ncbi:hypothetical protein V1511DRAFT_476202 [Dipodascopsis uninucleata]